MAIGSIIVLALLGIYFFSQNDGEVVYNPYGDKDIDAETVRTLKGEDYLYQITYDDFKENVLEKGESVFVYAFSPTCVYCEDFNPIINEIFGDEIKYYRLNVLEYPEIYDDLALEGVPTLFYFKSGEEMSRLVGLQDEETLTDFIVQQE